MLKNCCICLKVALDMILLSTEDPKQVKIIEKLQFIAPENEWLNRFSICSTCNTQLDNAYTFKHLCLASDKIRMELTEDEKPDILENSLELAEAPFKEEPAVFKHNSSDNKESSIVFEGKKPIIATKKFSCHHCNKLFASKTFLQKHIKTSRHSNKSPVKFHCEVCRKQFPLLKTLIKHCGTAHSMSQKEIKPYHCNQCTKKFNSSFLLQQHLKYHEANRSYVCSTCGKSYKTMRDLNGHEKLHKNQRKYNCDKCDKNFNTSQNLNTHIYVVHTDPDQWKYSCPVCDKKFAMKANCNEHAKRHQGNKKFNCHICQKSFVSNYEVKKHVKCHSNISQHECAHCPKDYKSKRYLDIHLFKAHGIGDVKLPVREKKFVCHICPNRYVDNGKLQRHLKTHTGEKPFSCPQCAKRFIDKSYLQSHLKKVHCKEKPPKEEEYQYIHY